MIDPTEYGIITQQVEHHNNVYTVTKCESHLNNSNILDNGVDTAT